MTALVAPFMLLVLAAAFGARLSIRRRPVPRRKPGETVAESHVILLGTFRVYSWLVMLVIAAGLLGVLNQRYANFSPLWYQGILMAAGALLLVLSQALYWRLGYDWRRWLFVLGHLTGAFCIAEYLWALRQDMEAYLNEYRDHSPRS